MSFRRRILKELFLALVVLFALTYTKIHPGLSAPNERSRVYLAVALVEDRSLSIDRQLARFGEIMDTARFQGRLYSDKAPGSSFLGALVYGTARWLVGPEGWNIQRLLELMRQGLMVPFGLLGFVALRALLRRSGATEPITDLVSLGVSLGTSMFHYSAAYYGHQLVNANLILALLLTLYAEGRVHETPRSAALLAWLAGACAGMAGLTEYQAGIPSTLLALYVLFGPLGRRVWGAAAFALGALPFLLLLGWYNQRCFGGVFQLSYHHLSDAGTAAIHSEGIGGITRPTWESFHGGILSWHRGLVTTSPCFLFTIPGVVVLYRRGAKRLAWLLGTATLYFVLFISSSNMWVAGWGFGPRLLVPGMGWMALLVAFGAMSLGRFFPLDGLFRGALLTGLVMHQSVRLFFAEPPNEAENPLLDVVLVLARARVVAPNRYWLELPGLYSLMPLLVMLCALALFFVWRRTTPRRIFQRLGVVFMAFATVAGVLSASWLTGPKYSEGTRRSLPSFVRGLE